MALTNQATITLAVNVQNMAGLSSLTKGLQSLQSRIMALQRNPAVRSAAGLTSPAQQARSQAAILRAQNQIQASQQRASLATQRYQMALGRLATMQQKAAAAAARHKANLGTLTQKISDAEHNVDALWRASFRLQMLGADFQRWGQALIGFVQGVTEQFGEFEFMANRAAGTLRLFNTDADSAAVSTYDLQDAVMSAAKELRLFPAEDVAKSVYFWGSTTGQVVESQEDLENVMSSLTPVMKAAALTQTDYETAIKGVYGIMTQFNPEIIEAANATGEYAEMAALAEEVTTRLFFATQVTALEYVDLVQAFKMVGPIAAGVGATLEDMVGLMGRLADLGLRGSMAGRSFRQMFMRMAAPPGPARKAIDALFRSLDPSVFGGKSYLEVMFPGGEFAGTTAFFENMTKAVKDLNTVERINFLTKFSTANLLPTMIALIGQEERRQADLGGEVDKTNVSLEKQREVFNQSWQLLSGSWKGAVEGFNRSMENLTLVVGRAFAEGLKPFVDMAGKAIDGIQEWVRANEPLVEQLGQWVAAIGGVLIVIGTLFIAMGSAIGVVAGLRLAFEAFGGTILRWTGYGVIIGAIIDAVIRNFDVVQSRLQEAQRAIQDALDNIAQYFSDGEEATGSFASAFAGMADMIVEHVTNAVVFISHLIEEISKFRPLFDLIKNIGIPVIAHFIAIMASVKLGMAVASFMKLPGLFKALSSSVSGVNSLSGAVGKLSTSFGNFLAKNPILVITAVAAFAFSAYEGNWLHFRDAVNGLTNSFRDLRDEIKGAYDDILVRLNTQAEFEKLGREGGITFWDAWKQQVVEAGTLTRGFGNFVVTDTFSITRGDLEGYRHSLSSLWDQWTTGARDAEEAQADVMRGLAQMGVDADAWGKGFVYALHDVELAAMDITPVLATNFGVALARSLEDGEASIKEFTAELTELTNNESYSIDIVNSLSDAQLVQLGITTRSAEEIANLTAEQEKYAASLVDTLKALPTTNLTDEQSTQAATLIAQLQEVWYNVGPEYQQIIDRAIAPYVAAGVDAGTAAGLEMADAQSLIMAYLADMGATHVPADLLSDLTNSLTLAIGEAVAATPGADIDFDALLKNVFSGLDISVVTDFLYPQISAIGDGVAAAIGAVFRPGKFKDKLKGITKDDKGWKNFWQAVTDPIFRSALAGERGSEAQAIADEWAQGLFDNFETAFPAASGPARDRLATQLTDFFNAKSLPGMSEGLQRFGTNLLVEMYDTLDQPMPEWLKTYFINFGGQIPGYIKDGAEGPQVTITPNVDINVPTPTVNQVDPRTGEIIVGNIQRQIDAQPRIVLPRPALPDFMGGGGQADGGGENMHGGHMSNPYLNFLTNTRSAMSTAPAVTMPPVGAPDTSAVTTAISSMSSEVGGDLRALAFDATTWGNHLVGNFAAAITASRWRAVNAATGVANAVKDKLKFSKGPTEGPLKGFNEWGNHMMQNYAASIEKGTPHVDKAVAKAADSVSRELRKGKFTSVRGAHLYNSYDGYLAYLGRVHNKINDFRTSTKRVRDETIEDLNVGRHRTEGKTRFETSNKKTVEVKISVESPDGSVNRTQLRAIRQGAMDAFAIADVEHMVTVS